MIQNISYLHIGDILGAHGLKGALTVFSFTRPAEAIADYPRWWLGQTAATATAHDVNRCWQHGKRMLVEFDGVADCNQAELLKGHKIWVPNDAVTVADDEHLWQDLIGCDVVLENTGVVLGTVSALEEYGAQDILSVSTTDNAEIKGEWMIPFIENVIVEVDLDEARITVNLPEGMDACFTPRF